MHTLRHAQQKFVSVGLWLMAEPYRLVMITALLVTLAFAIVMILGLSPTAVFIGPSGGGSGGGPV